MQNLIEQLVTAAVAKVPADIRQAEASSLRANMVKAWGMLSTKPEVCTGEDTAWTERVLRRMAEQYAPWRGQNRRSHEQR